MALDWLGGQRVLITGNTGFKGAWLSSLVTMAGAVTAGLADRVEQGSLFEHMVTPPVDQQFWGDVADVDCATRTLQEFRPTLVVHMAAESLVLRAFKNPRETWSTNVMGTANVLEAASALDSDITVLVVTSDKCYDNDESATARREGDRLGGADPYSASKAATELVVRSWPASENASWATVRGGNVLGGGDTAPNRLVPDFYRALWSGSTLEVRNPSAVRPWQDVRDCLYAYMAVAERLTQKVWPLAAANVGPKASGISVGELISILRQRHPQVDVTAGPNNAIEHRELRLDTTAIRSLISLPDTPIEESLVEADRLYGLMHNDVDMAWPIAASWEAWLT